MRRVPQLTLFFFFIAVTIFIACQREISLQPSNGAFDAAAAKEWYYGTFKKSAEWAASPQKGKKLPDWKHPVAGKIADYDVMEFPLTEETKSFALPSSLSFADRQKLAGASASKIQFLRKRNSNETLVREIDYIPDFEYARGKGFDISDESLLKPDNEFKGYITVKKWDGAIEGLGVLKDNKILKKGRILRNGAGSRPATETCTTTEFCIIQQDCIMYVYSDGMTSNECGEWYNTGDCWVEEYCIGSEGDICDMYNICDDGSGGGGNECQMSCSEAAASLAEAYVDELHSFTITNGTEAAPDANGIVKKPFNLNWPFAKINLGLGISATYSAFFSGIKYKQDFNTPQWRFESMRYDYAAKTAGTNPMCISISMQVNVAPIVFFTDNLRAEVSLGYAAQLNLPCSDGHEVRSVSGTVSNFFDAN